jgi:tetratricopeptide (TPR) repeat protein
MEYFNRAVEALFNALTLFPESAYVNRAPALNALGMLHGALGMHDQALKYHIESLRCDQLTGNTLGIAASYCNLASVCMLAGWKALALGYANAGSDLYHRLGKMDMVAELRQFMSELS